MNLNLTNKLKGSGLANNQSARTMKFLIHYVDVDGIPSCVLANNWFQLMYYRAVLFFCNCYHVTFKPVFL
jgi:hypothetical protein